MTMPFVRTFGNIDHGMNHGEVALGFLFPAFNFNRDAIGKFLPQMQEKLFTDDFPRS